MTLPTIKFGEIEGRHYAEFTPTESHPVRLYGDTQEEAQQAAWDFLAEDDRINRAKKPAEAKEDVIAHPSHYTRFQGIEVIQLTEQLNFCRGNAVKYIARAGAKDASKEVEDLKKAAWYIQREIERLES